MPDLWAVGEKSTIWHSADQPLPVELLRFQARREGSVAELSWQTATERNNAGFYIERSGDALQFLSIGFVAGQGYSAQTTDYAFYDDSLLRGLNYYRLRQTDYDGAATYSPVASVFFEDNTWSLFPNPTADWVELRDLSLQPGAYYRLIDPMGAIRQIGPLYENRIHLRDLPPGLYYLWLYDGTTQRTTPVVKH